MPDYDQVLQEIANAGSGDVGINTVRRRYLRKLRTFTGRATILYSSCYDLKSAGSSQIGIVRDDVRAMMSALYGVRGNELDLIVHSPGGSTEGAEQIVNYLRAKFRHIRVIVPQCAMSAATMIACASDRIVMGKHSAIGPIDPQISLEDGSDVPAQSLIDEYRFAKKEMLRSPQTELPWSAKITHTPRGLLILCRNEIKRSRRIVESWLRKYMFKGRKNASSLGAKVAKWLSTYSEHLTHGRPIGIRVARKHGLVVDALEDNQVLQELVLSIHHAAVATFLGTQCVKIVENHDGRGSFMASC